MFISCCKQIYNNVIADFVSFSWACLLRLGSYFGHGLHLFFTCTLIYFVFKRSPQPCIISYNIKEKRLAIIHFGNYSPSWKPRLSSYVCIDTVVQQLVWNALYRSNKDISRIGYHPRSIYYNNTGLFLKQIGNFFFKEHSRLSYVLVLGEW